jgi:hypothetical protein
MKFENERVMNFDGAFRGMRNPLESWAKSDSYFGLTDPYSDIDYDISALWGEKDHPEYYGDNLGDYEDKRIDLEDKYSKWLLKNGILYRNDTDLYYEVAFIGPNDMKLAKNLIAAGSSDRKFLRQIFVSVDITAPIYWWKECDQYRIGVTTNSTSTMHKLATTPITLDCFETDDFEDFKVADDSFLDNRFLELTAFTTSNYLEDTITKCEILRQRYNETKDKRYWKELIRLLPESWLQTRTTTMNYEVLRSMYFQRRHHKLSEWRTFTDWVASLPYAEDLILYEHN